MANNMSDYLEGLLIGYLFRTSTTLTTKPTTIAVALATSTLTDASTGTLGASEPATANAYQRLNGEGGQGTGNVNPLDANWAAPSGNNGTTSNSNVLTFPTCTTAPWGSITDVAICDNVTRNAGNIWFYGALSSAKTVGVGDIFRFNANTLQVQLDG